MRKSRLWGAVAALLLLLPGCTGGRADNYTMGKKIETAFFQFAVESTAREAVEDIWIDPPGNLEGKELLWVKITVENTTDGEIPLYYDDFDLLIDGVARFPERFFTQRQLLEEQMLKAGDTVTGELAYLIPKGEKKLALVYDEYYDDSTSGQQYTVKLSV